MASEEGQVKKRGQGHTCGSVIEAKMKSTLSSALQVPFLTAWVIMLETRGTTLQRDTKTVPERGPSWGHGNGSEVFLGALSQCTGENDPMGSSMKSQPLNNYCGLDEIRYTISAF